MNKDIKKYLLLILISSILILIAVIFFTNYVTYSVLGLLLLILISSYLINKKHSLLIEQINNNKILENEIEQLKLKRIKEVENNSEHKNSTLIATIKKEFRSKNLKTEKEILKYLINLLEGVQGVYFTPNNDHEQTLQLQASFAIGNDFDHRTFLQTEGFIGQAIINKNIMFIDDLPQDYTTILSGLGKSSPSSLIIIPIFFENSIFAIVEIALFNNITDETKLIVKEIPYLILESLSPKSKENENK